MKIEKIFKENHVMYRVERRRDQNSTYRIKINSLHNLLLLLFEKNQ